MSLLLYEYRDEYNRALNVYERIREGENVPLYSDFWTSVDEEFKRLEEDLRKYKYDNVYDQILDSKMTLKRIIKEIIEIRIYKIFMAIWKGEKPPEWLSEQEYKFYDDLKALIDNFKAELVPSLFSNGKEGFR